MLNMDSAINIVNEYLVQQVDSNEELAIAKEGKIEKNYGWIFFYNTKKYLDTKEISYALAGNGPVVVEKRNGQVTFLGTGKTIEKVIEEFERTKGFS